VGRPVVQLELGDHMCLPFGSDGERFEAFTEFLTAGMQGGFKMLLLTAVESVESLRARLTERVASYGDAKAGQVEIVSSYERYLAGGRFDGDRMIERYADAIDEADRQGYPGLWVNADMAWALDEPGAESLIEYETAVNLLFTSGRLAAICQYDRRLFDKATIADVCSGHPIIHGGARLRFTAVEEPPGLVLAGELDGTNNRLLASVLAPLSAVPAGLTIDATDVTYAGVEAAAMLARLAYLRRGRTTAVICRPQLRRLLKMLDTSGRLLVLNRPAHD
jgi:anti-anti-sigma regulatory factor